MTQKPLIPMNGLVNSYVVVIEFRSAVIDRTFQLVLYNIHTSQILILMTKFCDSAINIFHISYPYF